MSELVASFFAATVVAFLMVGVFAFLSGNRLVSAVLNSFFLVFVFSLISGAWSLAIGTIIAALLVIVMLVAKVIFQKK
ncbi:hypothetical protein VRZ08_07820 [Rhodopseudomonas sp. G2_2311]|uniref:hypothetical protein n=1 Tax=Rhodopseudomonas sp. G2_2311 TaxID=3114287 RepID=UPI0039C6921D